MSPDLGVPGFGGATTNLVYDGLDRIAEYSSSVVQRRYVHGPGIDEPLVQYEGSGTGLRRFFASDERGSVLSATDGSGDLLYINRYDEYGQPQSTNLGIWGYTGQARLPSIAAWYYKARVYEPELGRFLQPDPIDIGGGVNLYAYVRNDPVNWIDPPGLCPVGQIRVQNERDKSSSSGPDGSITVTWGTCVSWIPRIQSIFVDRGRVGPGAGGDRSKEDEYPPECSGAQKAFRATGKFLSDAGSDVALAGVGLGLIGAGVAAVSASTVVLAPGGVLAGGVLATAGGTIAVAGGVASFVGAGLQIVGGSGKAAIGDVAGRYLTHRLPNGVLKDASQSGIDLAVNAIPFDFQVCK